MTAGIRTEGIADIATNFSLVEYERWMVEKQWNGYPLNQILNDLPMPFDGGTFEWQRAYRALRSLFILCVGFTGEGGETLEHFKKHVRDGKFDKVKVALELGDRLAYLVWLIHVAGLTLEQVADLNKAKLDARRAAGTGAPAV